MMYIEQRIDPDPDTKLHEIMIEKAVKDFEQGYRNLQNGLVWLGTVNSMYENGIYSVDVAEKMASILQTLQHVPKTLKRRVAYRSLCDDPIRRRNSRVA